MLESLGHCLRRDDVRVLVHRTEGWPAGLRMAAMFLTRTGGTIDDFGADDQVPTEYLLGEVLAEQPAPTRAFLLYTCVPNRICADLADALIGDGRGRAQLQDLQRTNALTRHGPDQDWYTYHPLLRQALRHQLRLEHPDMLPALHRRAAHWFTTHGDTTHGQRHAAAAAHHTQPPATTLTQPPGPPRTAPQPTVPAGASTRPAPPPPRASD